MKGPDVYCEKCGTLNSEGAAACNYCGEPLAASAPRYEYVAEAPQAEGFAVCSLVVGLLSLITCTCGVPVAIAGITFGIVALARIGRRPDLFYGRSLAIAGMVTSGFGLLLSVALWVLVVLIDDPAKIEQFLR